MLIQIHSNSIVRASHAGMAALILAMLMAGVLSSASAIAAKGPKIKLFALFEGKAMLTVGDKRHLLKVGESTPDGIKLLRTDTENEVAYVRIGDKEERLRLGAVLASNFTEPDKAKVVLYKNTYGHFETDGQINGHTVRFLVDTGATSIALNSKTAERIGLRYKSLGTAGYSSTAAGVVRAWYLKLNTVKVRDIVMRNVDAGVIEGNYPTEVLLGMSFLGKLDMKQDEKTLQLQKRY